MTIDEKVELVRKALEKGASVDVHYHGVKTEEEATTFMNELGLSFEQRSSKELKAAYYRSPDYKFYVCSIYNYKEEEPLPFADPDFLMEEEVM